MNADVTRVLSGISVPCKQMVLSVLRLQSDLTISQISSMIELETDGEVQLGPASLRYAAKETLEKNNLVRSSARKHKKRPVFWELCNPFYGDLAQKALIFESEIKHPIEFFTGEPTNTSSTNSIYSAHMLYLASQGELDNIHFDQIPSVPFASLDSAYSLLEKKLLFRRNKDFIISELGIYFVKEIYLPTLEFSLGQRKCIRGLGFSDRLNIGNLYVTAQKLQKEYRSS